MEIALDQRLQTIFDWACCGRRIVDVGADHGRLSAALAACPSVEKILATERQESRSAPLRQRLDALGSRQASEIRIGDGLSVLKKGDRFDTVIFAGMGAEAMLGAFDLRPAEVDPPERWILQPQGDIGAARRGLTERRYRIVREKILEVRGWIYEIIEAHLEEQEVGYRHPSLDVAQIHEVGPCLLQQPGELIRRKWQRKTAELRSQLDRCEDRNGIRVLEEKHRRCREILTALEDADPLV
jgi:tRNA (adenine22-N1)-methyltransferase